MSRRTTYPAELLSADEIRAMLRVAGRGIAPDRNRSLIVCMWRAGLRVSEACSLLLRDLDRERGTIRVRRGKGHRPRTVSMDPEAWAVVELWLRRRAQLGLITTLVHPTRHGTALQTSYVRAMLPRLARRAGIERRVHPHALRRACAVELAEEGVPLTVIAQVLGHSRVSVTSAYLDEIRPGQVIDAMAARPSWTKKIKSS